MRSVLHPPSHICLCHCGLFAAPQGRLTRFQGLAIASRAPSLMIRYTARDFEIHERGMMSQARKFFLGRDLCYNHGVLSACLNCGESAINGKHAPNTVVRFIRGEKYRHPCKIFGFAQTPSWYAVCTSLSD